MRADKSLSPFEIRLYRHYRIVHGIRIALAFILTFLLVRLFSIPEGTWPLITLVVIMGPISFWGNVVPRAFEAHRRYDSGRGVRAGGATPGALFLTADCWCGVR
ncbi:Putative inner membrane protein [Salmonella enterica subsp. enterica]|uniref:Inner membrane protein n=1 Tax=Salmonella enterica I TaxID=59201 RepID=A0A3S4I321_SALET|nr:Putative inner membrane protein [Salmonella enterica subsp. enterica]